MRQIFVILISFFLFFETAKAREDLVPGSRYTSGRGAAMGDAVLPLGEDGPSGLFYNPADIAKIRKISLEPIDFAVYGSQPYFNILNLSFIKVTSLNDYKSTLIDNPDKFIGAGGHIVPTYSMPGFAMGILYQNQVGAIYNSADGSIHYRSLYQLIPTAGVGIRLAGGIVRIGYSMQWVNQASGDYTVPSDTDPMAYNQGLSQGSAVSHNLGFALTLPIKYLPSVNIVARNFLTARFSSYSLMQFSSSSVGPPPDEPTTYDISFSMQPKLGAGSYLNAVIEYRDVTNTSNDNIYGRVALGIELSIVNQAFLRGGWSGGYPSAGIGFRRKGGEFSLTWYSEEVGMTYQSLRDSRFLLNYQVRAF